MDKRAGHNLKTAVRFVLTDLYYLCNQINSHYADKMPPLNAHS